MAKTCAYLCCHSVVSLASFGEFGEYRRLGWSRQCTRCV